MAPLNPPKFSPTSPVFSQNPDPYLHGCWEPGLLSPLWPLSSVPAGSIPAVAPNEHQAGLPWCSFIPPSLRRARGRRGCAARSTLPVAPGGKDGGRTARLEDSRRWEAGAAQSRLQDLGGVGYQGLQGSLDESWRKLGHGLRTRRALARATLRGGQEGACLRLCLMGNSTGG